MLPKTRIGLRGPSTSKKKTTKHRLRRKTTFEETPSTTQIGTAKAEVPRARETLRKIGIQVELQDTVQSGSSIRLTAEKCGEYVQSTSGGGKKCSRRSHHRRNHERLAEQLNNTLSTLSTQIISSFPDSFPGETRWLYCDFRELNPIDRPCNFCPSSIDDKRRFTENA
jgi:hypothetical protein